MKKILFLLLFLFVLSIEVSPQDIIGKWKTPQQKVGGGMVGWIEMEYKPDNTFTLVLKYTGTDLDDMVKKGVLLYCTAKAKGKYEYSGKALSVDYDLESSILDFSVEFTSDCTLQPDIRKKLKEGIGSIMPPELKKQVESLLKIHTTAGMYRQILMLNYEKMCFGLSDGKRDPYEYYRIIPKDELTMSQKKREDERSAQRQARLKHEEELALEEKSDDETGKKKKKKIIKDEDLVKYELKENTTQGSYSVNNQTKSADDDDCIFDVIEVNARFPGGDEACFKWLTENMVYPAICKEQGIEGRVIVQFVVNKDGTIVDVKTVRSPDPNLTKEAERVVKEMPKWKPARQGNKTVRSRFNLPVMFRLN